MSDAKDSSEQKTRTPSAWLVDPVIQQKIKLQIEKDPHRHHLAQSYGEFLVDHPIFSQLTTFQPSLPTVHESDSVERLLLAIKNYGYKPSEMEPSELVLLKEKLGSTWKEQLMQDYGFSEEDFSET